MCLTSWLLTIIIIHLWKWTNRYEQDQHARSRATQQLLLVVRWRLAHAWFGLDEAVSLTWPHRSSQYCVALEKLLTAPVIILPSWENTLTCLHFFNSPAYKKVDF